MSKSSKINKLADSLERILLRYDGKKMTRSLYHQMAEDIINEISAKDATKSSGGGSPLQALYASIPKNKRKCK